jgi:hypothetical protein
MGMLFPILSVLFHKDSGKPSGSESPYEHEKIRCEGWTMLNPTPVAVCADQSQRDNPRSERRPHRSEPTASRSSKRARSAKRYDAA